MGIALQYGKIYLQTITLISKSVWCVLFMELYICVRIILFISYQQEGSTLTRIPSVNQRLDCVKGMYSYAVLNTSKVSESGPICFQKRLRNFSSENEGNVLTSLGQHSRDQKTHTVALENWISSLHTHVIDPLKFWQ
jgi:hypothetical protein